MNARLAHICRHPIKAVGFESLDRVALTPDAPVPLDRVWAVAHEAARLPEGGGWAAKTNFLRGVSAPALMAVSARTLGDGRIALAHPGRGAVELAPDEPADAARLIDWLRPLWPEGRPAPAQVVRAARGAALTDRSEPYVSVLNCASNRDLGKRLGHDLSIHRWRGNLWLDGLDPWTEFGLIGHELSIGPARLRIEARITRCKATTVDPATGHVDANTLGTLTETFGHQDFGVYARVIAGGHVAVGDGVAR